MQNKIGQQPLGGLTVVRRCMARTIIYGLGELIPQLTGEFQLWYDNNAWLAPKLVILSHQKLLFF